MSTAVTQAADPDLVRLERAETLAWQEYGIAVHAPLASQEQISETYRLASEATDSVIAYERGQR